jgi:hypothetical protein
MLSSAADARYSADEWKQALCWPCCSPPALAQFVKAGREPRDLIKAGVGQGHDDGLGVVE